MAHVRLIKIVHLLPNKFNSVDWIYSAAVVESIFSQLVSLYLVAHGERGGKESGVRAPTPSCEKLLLDFFFRLGFRGIMRLGTPLFPFTG